MRESFPLSSTFILTQSYSNLIEMILSHRTFPIKPRTATAAAAAGGECNYKSSALIRRTPGNNRCWVSVRQLHRLGKWKNIRFCEGVLLIVCLVSGIVCLEIENTVVSEWNAL